MMSVGKIKRRARTIFCLADLINRAVCIKFGGLNRPIYIKIKGTIATMRFFYFPLKVSTWKFSQIISVVNTSIKRYGRGRFARGLVKSFIYN